MRFLPLFKYTSRAQSTSWMIALCTMFIVASFSVIAGLQTSVDALTGNFEEEHFLVTRPDGVDPGLFDRLSVDACCGEAAFGLYAVVAAQPADEDITAFSFDDEHGLVAERYAVDANEALVGTQLDLSGAVSLQMGDSSEIVVVSGSYTSSVFPSNWLLCNHEVMASLTSAGASQYNFAIVDSLTAEEAALLKDDGFVIQPMVAILGFLESGAEDVQSAAMWVLLPSSFVVAVLVYSFIGSEIADRRREIGILKTIGASRKRLVSYLMADAFLVTAWGAALGIALGIILSYGISSLASHMFTSVFLIEMDERLLLLAYGITILSGVAGTVIPAVTSTHTPPVADLKEAT